MARDADVLVIFGISGDLAKVMTFRSLYRLEARELLVASRLIARCISHRISNATTMMPMIRSGLTMIT